MDTGKFYLPDERIIADDIFENTKQLWEINSQISKDKKNTTELSEDEYLELIEEKKNLTKKIGKLKSDIKSLLKKNIHMQRELYMKNDEDEKEIKKSSISLFNSSLTRALGMSSDTFSKEISDELIVVRVYYFDIFNSLVNNGFFYKGEKYIFLTASAGQIRTKKNVFIKESSFRKIHDTLFCGLSIDKINSMGGVNRNKYLAYLALCNSATDTWSGFDIDRCIVVDDVETEVVGLVDYIHSESWEIERKEMSVPVTHTDGCGMMLPSISKKNFMFRMPWFKGLLISFPFDEWIREHGGQSKVKDIYGDEYNIFEDNIQIIFTKSQFKMWKYYKNWQEYKYYFKKYMCEAATCNKEEDYIDNGCLSYQMIQTLSDLTDDELRKLAEKTNLRIQNISKDQQTMLRCFGIKKSNNNKNYFQKSLELYPEMLSDAYARNILSEIKKKTVKEGRSGRLKTYGKYTFISPDWYAMCERMFGSKDKPVGLLKDGEVYCRLFRKVEKLDCLRSPHLYREHAVRKNAYVEKSGTFSKWFRTDALYTSCHDLISKIMMFDVDGDTSLVVADETLVDAAERNCEDVVPLYYEMSKAKDAPINNTELYEGMITAYTGGNIGEISNNISKEWNSDEVDCDLIKCLCRQNNEVIDYAKTLYKSPVPSDLDIKIKKNNNSKLPHFFIYAKDKKPSQVSKKNDSPVNRLEDIIVDERFKFNENVTGKFNYKNLINNQNFVYNPDIKLHQMIVDEYKKLLRENRSLYNDMDGENGNYALIYSDIRSKMVEQFGQIDFIVDVLVSYLFDVVKSKRKNVLWGAFGDMIYKNIEQNISSDTFACSNCGKRIKKSDDPKRNAQKYCSECSSDIQYYRPIMTKFIICEDCGTEFEVSSKANNRTRCDACQELARKSKYKRYNDIRNRQ